MGIQSSLDRFPLFHFIFPTTLCDIGEAERAWMAQGRDSNVNLPDSSPSLLTTLPHWLLRFKYLELQGLVALLRNNKNGG